MRWAGHAGPDSRVANCVFLWDAAAHARRNGADNPAPEAEHVVGDRLNSARTASCESECCTSCARETCISSRRFTGLREAPPSGITSTEQLPVSSSKGVAERTLDLHEAAAFLRMHPEEVRTRAKRGLIPGAKPGRSWVFLESDLAEFLRSLYPVRRQALQVTTSQEAICHFTTVPTLVEQIQLVRENRLFGPLHGERK